jgi:hypothetical protein
MNCIICGKKTDALRDDICLDCHGEIFKQDFLESSPLVELQKVKILEHGRWRGQWGIVGENFNGGWHDLVLVNVQVGKDNLFQWFSYRRDTISKL